MTNCSVCKRRVEGNPDMGIPAIVSVLVKKTVHCKECYDKFENHVWIEDAIKKGDYRVIKV